MDEPIYLSAAQPRTLEADTLTADTAGAPESIAPNAENVYRVTRADLPLSCPMPGMSLWNSHPRVYLPIEDEGGESLCPYCGARYLLETEGS